MLRLQVIKVARINAMPIQRSFSVGALRAAEGDTGSTRSGGSAQSDSFSKREAAAENKFIREKEMERHGLTIMSVMLHSNGMYSLRKLKEKLQNQRKHLNELESHIKELEKEGGGEVN